MCLFFAINVGPAMKILDPENESVAVEEEYPYVLLIVKYICAMILHLTMHSKVEKAIERLYYIKRHPYKFENINLALNICFKKLAVEICTEITSIALTAAINNPSDVVIDYVSLTVISKLDEVYYDTIRTPLKEQLEDEHFELPIENMDNINLSKGEDIGKFTKCQFKFLKVVRVFYELIYFYMFPYLLFAFI